MKNFLLYLFLAIFPASLLAQNTIEADAVAFYNRSMPAINAVYQNTIAQNVRQLKTRNINADSLKKAFNANTPTKTLEPMEVNALVQWVLTESYLESAKDLEDMARKIRYFNELKKKLRESTKADSLKILNNLITRIQNDIPPVQKRQNALAIQISKIMIKDRSIQNQVIQRLKTK